MVRMADAVDRIQELVEVLEAPDGEEEASGAA